MNTGHHWPLDPHLPPGIRRQMDRAREIPAVVQLLTLGKGC